MGDPLKRIDKLVRLARTESPPPVEISARVMAAIRERDQQDDAAPLKWIALGSAVASLAVCIEIVSVYQTWSDPLTAMVFELFRMVL